MKLVIDIPEEEYRWIKKSDKTVFASVASKECMLHAIKNGTPLPKGHGRLIDADELKKIIQENDVLNMTGFNVRLCDINNASTIIEADKAESEEISERNLKMWEEIYAEEKRRESEDKE